jgi:hypothetical protein
VLAASRAIAEPSARMIAFTRLASLIARTRHSMPERAPAPSAPRSGPAAPGPGKPGPATGK